MFKIRLNFFSITETYLLSINNEQIKNARYTRTASYEWSKNNLAALNELNERNERGEKKKRELSSSDGEAKKKYVVQIYIYLIYNNSRMELLNLTRSLLKIFY